MNTGVVVPPTPQVCHAVELLNQSISFALMAGPRPPLGRFESDVEAVVLFSQATRHLEGIIELAKADLVLLPPAATLARSVCEICARTEWMLHPDEEYDREARWLAHIRGEEEYLRRWSNRQRALGLDSADAELRAQQIEEFRTRVEAKLPTEIRVQTVVPDLASQLREIGEERRYLIYMALSQTAHGTHAGGRFYRQHLGRSKQLGEFVEMTEWRAVLGLGWNAYSRAAGALFRRIAPNVHPFGDIDAVRVVDEVIAAIS